MCAKEGYRSKRVAELIQREAARLLQTNYFDLVKGFITVVEVTLGKDLSFARIFVSIMGDESSITSCLLTLNEHASEFRRLLAGRIKLRTIPELHFYYDPSIQEGNRISALIDKAIQK